MQVAAQPLDKLPNGDRLCFDDGFHDQLAGGIHHRDSGCFLVNVQSNVFCTVHDRCSFLLQGQRQRHKLTSKGAPFYNASYTCRMNDLVKDWIGFFRYNSCPDCVASTFPRLVGQRFPFPGGPRPREPGSPSAIAGSARATTSPSIKCPAQVVLGCVENVLVRMDQAAHLGHRELASSGVSFVLDVGLEIQPGRGTAACQQGGSRLDPSDGFRESDLGSSAHARRTTQAGFRALGKECLAMDPASSERSRFREAMADVPQKPSRGNCGNGFLHRPNAHVWCSVLLFRHRPRPTEDPAFQCDAKSQCTSGCTAIERSMDRPTAAPSVAIRPGSKVWSRSGFGCKGHGKRANSNGLSQSVAERCCGALGGKLPTRLAGPRDW